MPKPIILTFVAYYLPGYKSGGPVRTIANMVEQLGDVLDFRIITADRDALDTKPYPNVVIDEWNTVGKAKVFYASPENRSLLSFARLISRTPHDVLYLNGFFSPSFTIRPLLARRLGLIRKRPTVLASRGEFSEGALALKWWKKWPYIVSMRLFGLYKEITWQASSKYEANDIRKTMGSTAERIILAPNLSAVPNDVMGKEQQKDRARAPSDPLRVCFMSRITPKKNLHYALQVLAEVMIPVEFDIYGTISNEPYWQHCQKLVKRLPVHVVARYQGVIDHANVAQTLAKYDMFFLPTLGENYGHVIFEALASGLPVLLSDQTPWRNLEALGVGWDLSLKDIKQFRAIIEAQAELNNENRVAQKLFTKQYAQRIAMDKNVLACNLNMFTEIIA